jgi:penicillin-binding protein 1A
MAAAYGAIANGGVYLEPLSFTKVLDAEGNVILDADEVRQTRRGCSRRARHGFWWI